MNTEPPPGGGASGGSSKAPPPTEWVEIIEPRSGEHMFANLTTGECVWDPPVGVAVKKTNDNQWWELFDQNTSRFYYYNATTQTTVWHRPADCDIIPLAKLQTLKQNTEVATTANKPIASPDEGEETDKSSLLSPGKRRLKKQVQKHQRRGVKGHASSEVQTENASPLARLLPTSSTEAIVSSSSFAQTSPLPSPRLSSARRRSSHRHYQHHHINPQGSSSQPRSASGLSKQLSLESENFKKYCTNPTREKQPGPETSQVASSQQYLPGASAANNLQGSSGPGSSNSSIARSVSFMSKRQESRVNAYDNYAPIGWRTGRNSVEGTPTSSRKGLVHSKASSMNGSTSNKQSPPGYSTPLTSRKPTSTSTSQQQLPQQQPMSISELVDTGLSTLGQQQQQISSSKQNNNGANCISSQNNFSSNQSKSMSPLQAYILEQAKLSGYDVADDRDSYVESDIDSRKDPNGSDSDDFADDEGCQSDNLSKTSSSVEDDYLNAEPMYNNLESMWRQNEHVLKKKEVDAFSQEFDLRMKIGNTTALPPTTTTNQTQATNQNNSLIRSQSNSGNTVTNQPNVNQNSLRSQNSSGNNGQNDRSAPQHPISENLLRSNGNLRESQRSQHHHHSSTMPRPASIQPTMHHSSSSGHQQHHHGHSSQNYPVPYDVLHPSLQRNAHSLMVDPMALQKANHMIHNRGVPGPGSSLSLATASITASMEADMEKYAQDNFNVQKRGLFRKRLSIKAILSWTTDAINKPLTSLPTDEKSVKKEAVQAYRLIQIYMGDRKAKPDMTINTVAFDITTMGYNKPSLRDEIFVQLCKQTTDNPKKDSLRRGWELMAICLAFFPPSATFAPFLQGYIAKHRDPSLDEFPDAHKWPIHIQISHYSGICAKRLERIGDNGRLRPKKPNLEDIDQSRLLIFRPSMFGGTLPETMEVQRDRFPHLRLPWILTTVADQILRLNGTGTEGIFRIPADFEEVISLKSRFDQWEVVLCRDSHTAASLLKTWLRELYEPLIPDHFYDECIALAVNLDKESVSISDSERAKRLTALVSRLPDLTALVLMYLIRFLQLFAQSQIYQITKMDDSNLATVFAPNFLRCPSMDPMVIMESARKEMSFVKHLIQCLDTTIAEGIL